MKDEGPPGAADLMDVARTNFDSPLHFATICVIILTYGIDKGLFEQRERMLFSHRAREPRGLGGVQL